LDELHRAVRQVLLDVLQFAAGEVIHDAHLCPALHQGIGEVGADEGGSPRNQNATILPE
jgi:hypothetical protein